MDVGTGIIVLTLIIVIIMFCVGLVICKAIRNITGIIITIIATGLITIVFIILGCKWFNKSVKSSYDSAIVVSTNDILNVSYDGGNNVVTYVLNNEITHYRTDKMKIFYDLEDGKKPYMEVIEYKHWIFCWKEATIHESC